MEMPFLWAKLPNEMIYFLVDVEISFLIFITLNP